MLDRNFFIDLISELENHFNKELTQFAKVSYYKRLGSLSKEEFTEAIHVAIASSYRFPTADALREYAGRCPDTGKPTGDHAIKALPSTEQKIMEEERTLTPEQRMERVVEFRRRVSELIREKGIGGTQKPASANSPEPRRASGAPMSQDDFERRKQEALKMLQSWES